MSTEYAIRDALRLDVPLMALLHNQDDRVSLEFTGTGEIGTRVLMHRAGGPVLDQLALDVAAMNFHCRGTSRKAAADLADAVIGALHRVRPTPSNPVRNVSDISGPTWLPDGTQALYVVTAVVTSRMAGLVPVA